MIRRHKTHLETGRRSKKTLHNIRLMAKKYLKKDTKSLIIRKMQINTTGNTNTLAEWLKLKILTTSNDDENRDQPQLAHTVLGNVTRYSHFGEIIWQFLVKLNTQQLKS